MLISTFIIVMMPDNSEHNGYAGIHAREATAQ